jgi:hypothetical protein
MEVVVVVALAENPRLTKSEALLLKCEEAASAGLDRKPDFAASELVTELWIAESDCVRETMLRDAGEFSQTSPPWPAKLRTAPVDPGVRFPLRTCQPPLFADPGSAGAAEGPRLCAELPKECQRPSFAAAGAEAEDPTLGLPLGKLLPGRE